MQNFVFHNPTKIIFGRGTVPAIGTEAAAIGSRILLVFGQASARRSGLLDQVLASLADAGVEAVVEHGGVCPNPLLGHVRDGIAKVRAHGLNAVVAVGGGSSVDAAKAIAAGSLIEHDIWELFAGRRSVEAALPVAVVLTLAAAGSEMNSGMVVTNEATDEKFGCSHRLLHPKVSILDPELTFSVPASHTAYGAIDAIAHVLEFYMTTTDEDVPVQAELMEGLIRNAMRACERCLADPCDYGGRAALMWTATLALNGLTGAGLGRTSFPMHMIEHSLSALHDVPHGAGLATVIPAWLRWRLPQDEARIARLGRAVLGLHGPKAAVAEQTVDALRSWMTSVRAPVSLAQLNIPADDIPRLAENAMRLARTWQMHDYSQSAIEEVLNLGR